MVCTISLTWENRHHNEEKEGWRRENIPQRTEKREEGRKTFALRAGDLGKTEISGLVSSRYSMIDTDWASSTPSITKAGISWLGFSFTYSSECCNDYNQNQQMISTLRPVRTSSSSSPYLLALQEIHRLVLVINLLDAKDDPHAPGRRAPEIGIEHWLWERFKGKGKKGTLLFSRDLEEAGEETVFVLTRSWWTLLASPASSEAVDLRFSILFTFFSFFFFLKEEQDKKSKHQIPKPTNKEAKEEAHPRPREGSKRGEPSAATALRYIQVEVQYSFIHIVISPVAKLPSKFPCRWHKEGQNRSFFCVVFGFSEANLFKQFGHFYWTGDQTLKWWRE